MYDKYGIDNYQGDIRNGVLLMKSIILRMLYNSMIPSDEDQYDSVTRSFVSGVLSRRALIIYCIKDAIDEFIKEIHIQECNTIICL